LVLGWNANKKEKREDSLCAERATSKKKTKNANNKKEQSTLPRTEIEKKEHSTEKRNE